MEWLFNGIPLIEFPEDYVGFVYLIENLLDGRKYIGKKLSTSTRTKLINGKKKKVKTESNWKKYFGSNDELIADVKLHGAENFKRTILHMCISKSDCNYLEAREQFDMRVLEKPELFYNRWIMVKVRGSQLKLTNITL